MPDRRAVGPPGYDQSVAHSPCPLPCFDPNAVHLGLNLAKATFPDTAAWTVAQILRAIHWTGHAGRGKHALAAHTAVKQEALDQPLGHRRRSLQSLIADRFENGGKPHYGALEDPVYAFEKARMANGEATNGVHSDCDLFFGSGCLPHWLGPQGYVVNADVGAKLWGSNRGTMARHPQYPALDLRHRTFG